MKIKSYLFGSQRDTGAFDEILKCKAIEQFCDKIDRLFFLENSVSFW